MLFTPQVKPKRCGGGRLRFQPFPCDSEEIFDGTFTGLSVEVSDETGIKAFFNNGCFGKGSQSRSVPNTLLVSSTINQYVDKSEIKETLSIALEEAFYLSFFLKVLRICSTTGNPLHWQIFLKEALKVNEHFLELLSAYVHLKSKGWIVKSGMKFGGDFLIYRRGPRYFHASFVVAVTSSSKCDNLESNSVKCFQRIAETSHKDVLILEVDKPQGYRMKVLEDLNQLQISESIIRRFNYTSFVQHQKTQQKK